MSILSVQSCAVDGVSSIPGRQSPAAQDSSADMESPAPEPPPSSASGAPRTVTGETDSRMEEGNAAPFEREEKGTLVLTADIPVSATTPQLHPIATDTAPLEREVGSEKHSGDESAVGVKVCTHCGASTDRARAKKCQSCHKFFVERGVSYPCPKSHYAGMCGLPDDAPFQCNLVPTEGGTTGAVPVENADPKVVAAWSGDSNSKAANNFDGGIVSKGDCLMVQSESGKDRSTLLPSQAGHPTSSSSSSSTTQVIPTGSLAPVSEQEECTISATTRSGKMYKTMPSSLEQPSSVVEGGGCTDAVSSSVTSTLSSLVSMGNVTFALPLLHTTTVGAALLNISNSSLSSSALENCFSPSLHPVTVIDIGGIATSRLVPSPTSAVEAIAPSNVVAPANPPGTKLSPLTSQLPVMLSMTSRATIGDALNYVMTRSSSQGAPVPPLVSVHPAPPLVSTPSTPPFNPAPSTPPPRLGPLCAPLCPSHLHAPTCLGSFRAPLRPSPLQGGSTAPESTHQPDTSASGTVGGFDSELAKVSGLHNPNEIITAFPRSEPAGLVQQSISSSQQAVVVPDEGVVPTSEVPSQSSPTKIPGPSPHSDTAEVGGNATPSPLPPLLYKDGESPAPPTSDVEGEKEKESSHFHFFSAKFRNRYGHLERSDGKGLKRVSYPDGNNSAVKKMKGIDSSLPGSSDLFGVSPAALNRTDMLGGPRQVVAPITTQFQRQIVTPPKSAPGAVTYQKVVSSSASSPAVTGSGPGLATGSNPGMVAGSNPGMVVGKAPVRPIETSSIRPLTSAHLAPSPLQALHLSLHAQNSYHPSPSLHSPSLLHVSTISMATHGIHSTTPTSGLLPIPPLIKTPTVFAPMSPSSPSQVSSSSSLSHANIISNVLLRPALASSAVMGSVTAQLLKPQGEAKPGTTVVRVLSPTPTLSSGSPLPPRSKVSAPTVFPSIAMTTSNVSLPTTAKSGLGEQKAAILSQGGRESADRSDGTSARTSPPLISPGGSRAKVVYTSTITGPRSSPGAIEGGTDGLIGKGALTNKVPLAGSSPANDLQKLTCAIQSRIKQVLEKEPEPEQLKVLPLSTPDPTLPPSISLASRPHTSQPPPKSVEGICTSVWMPPAVGCPPALVGPPVATAPSVQSVSTDKTLTSISTERPVSTASVATFTERSVGTSTERSVGTLTERSVGTFTERSVGTLTERCVGTSTERSVTSHERVVSPVERAGSGGAEKCGERAVTSSSERNVSERITSSSTPAACSSNSGLHRVKEEYQTDVDGVAVQERDLKRNGESDCPQQPAEYSKLHSDEAMESGSEENSENGNANNDSMDGDTQVFSVKLKDCFMHHVMWNNFKMVFLVPLLHESRLATSSELPAVKMEDVNSEEECGDSKDTSPSSSQSGVPITPCFSVYELRTKLFSSFSPSAVYVYTYKNNIRSYKPPIHWVYVMKRMGGVQDTCHTCRLLGMQHVKNICDYYRIRLPSILDMLGRNEMPPGRKVVDLSHIGPEELDQEHLDLIPSCAFVDTPSKAQSKLPRKRGRKYAHQGEPSPPTPSEQSECVDNVTDQCDGYDGNSSINRYQPVGKKKPCPQCGTNILKKCKKCPLCGKTFGLFAFGRRQCTSCGRVNLAKYSDCNKCGANLQNAPIALPKDDETRDSPQPPSEYVCKRRRLHNLPVTYSSRDHDDGETPLGPPPLSRRASTTASDADEEMVDYGEEFDVDCPDDSEMSSAKSPTKSRHAGYQYGRVPWANTEVAVLLDEKGVLRFCLHELCTRVLTEHSKADVFNMVKDLNLPMEQGDMPLLKKLQALGMHSNRSPICRLIVAEDLWALLDALQEPVPDEVHQHLETVTLNTPFNTSYPSSPAPPPASRPSQLNISRSSPEPLSTPPIPAVQDSPAMMLNPGTTPVIAEDESGFESTLHEMQCSDGQYVSILRAWNGGQYVCLPEVWRKYFPEVNRNNLTGVLKKLELDTHLPTGQQATLLRSAGVISLRGAPGRLMKLEDMQALLDSFGIPLQIGTGKALTPAKQVSHQTTPKPRPSNIAPKPVVRACDERPIPILKDNPTSIGDFRLAHCMRNILIALVLRDIEKLLTDCTQSVFEASDASRRPVELQQN
eukprot:Em0020g702a